MAELGLGAYRFSIAWSRVLPEGTGRGQRGGARLLRPPRRRAARARDRAVRDALPLGSAAGARGRAAAGRRARPPRRSPSTRRRRRPPRRPRPRTSPRMNEPYVVADHGYRIGSHAPGRDRAGRRARRGTPPAGRARPGRAGDPRGRAGGGGRHRPQLPPDAPGDRRHPLDQEAAMRRARPGEPLVPRPDRRPAATREDTVARLGLAPRRGARRRPGADRDADRLPRRQLLLPPRRRARPAPAGAPARGRRRS